MSGTSAMRTALLVAVPAVVVVVSVVVVVVDARAAMYVLAAALVGFGVARLCLPAEAGVEARSRTFDVVVLLGLAVAIGLLAPWGNAALPVAA